MVAKMPAMIRDSVIQFIFSPACLDELYLRRRRAAISILTLTGNNYKKGF